jgi:3-methylfumaryl-CoA hydratase
VSAAEAWQPVTERAVDVVTPAMAAALHGLLDSPGEPPGPGDPLPPLWHWLAFLPRVPQRDLGADGHPRLGGFMPPVELPRRMFAGGWFEFEAPAPIGEPLERESRVTSVEEKSGRSGALVFVKVRHEVRAAGRLAVVEEQDIVYRGETAPATPKPPAAAPAPAAAVAPAAAAARGRGAARPPAAPGQWSWDLPIDPTLLFRFSALTYNAHRIHYDRRYATEVEGYPGLVVHGPLQAVALAELCRRRSDRPLGTFRFRAVSPAFDDGPVHLHGTPDPDSGSVALTASDDHGTATMQATATLTGVGPAGSGGTTPA